MLTATNQLSAFTKVLSAQLSGLFQNNLRTQMFQKYLKYYTKINITTHCKI